MKAGKVPVKALLRPVAGKLSSDPGEVRLFMPGALPFRAWPRPVGEALSLPDSLLPAFELVAVPAGSCAGAMRRGLRQGTIRIIMPEMRQKVEKKGGSVSFRAYFECSGREDEVSAACEVLQGHRSQAF